MSEKEKATGQKESPFYCYAFGITPEEGRHRTVLARLQELKRTSARLMRVRWAAIGVLAAATTAARWMPGVSIQAGALYFAAAAVLLYTIVFDLLASGKPKAGEAERELARAATLATAQIATDLAALTVILHYSGGVENPFLFYYVFEMIIGSMLLTRRASFYMATLAAALFSGLAATEYSGALAHYALWPAARGLYGNGTFVASVVAVFVSTMYLAVYFAGSVVEKLRASQAELIAVTSSLEKGSLQLVEAYERIRALEEKKSAFMRVASHQLRSPLSAITSLLDVILHGFAGDAEKQRELVQRAHDRTGHMLAMLNDLLALSRLEDAGEGEQGEPESVNVCGVLADIQHLYRPRAESKGLRFTTAPPQAPCRIQASTDDVRQALNNLVDNAINYTKPGGSVAISAQSSGGKVVVRVSDTGIGVPEESMDQLFTEFHRAANAKEQLPHGTGLGLAIVKRAVEKWHGRIAVDSKVGEGTTFTIEFPTSP